MHLNDHSLRQIDDAYLRSLEPEALCALSLRLLADLKEARDRLHQGPENSSRPPSSRVPWERTSGGQVSDEDLSLIHISIVTIVISSPLWRTKP